MITKREILGNGSSITIISNDTKKTLTLVVEDEEFNTIDIIIESEGIEDLKKAINMAVNEQKHSIIDEVLTRR